MPEIEPLKHRPAQAKDAGKLVVDTSSIPKDLQERAPQTNGEKHFDRTIAFGLFFAIYAASVVGAVVIKKHPFGNKGFYTPLKNAFRGITNYLYEGKYTAEAEKLVEGGAKSAEALLSQVKKVLWDVKVAQGTETRSAQEFLKVFEQHEGFLNKLTNVLEKEHGLHITGNGLEKLHAAAPEAREALKVLAKGVDEAVGEGLLTAEESTTLKKILKDYKLDKQTEDLSEIISLSMGGTAVVLPYKVYDDRRHKAIIQNYDAKHGTGIDDPLLSAAAQARVANLATQSWPSALMTRFGALGVLVATAYTPVLGEGIITTQKRWGAQLVETKPAIKLMEWLGERNWSWFPYKPDVEKLAAVSATSRQFTGEMIAADGTWTMYTTALMLAFGKVFAPLFGNKSKGADNGAYTPYIEPKAPSPVYEQAPAAPEPRGVPMAQGAPTSRVQHALHDTTLAHAHEQALSH